MARLPFCVALALVASPNGVTSFSPASLSVNKRSLSYSTSAVARAKVLPSHEEESSSLSSDSLRDVEQFFKGFVLASAAAVAAATTFVSVPGVAFADEYGKETEAPTLFTGETVMICKKRGPLGACLETEVRTVENDNDKASKYFRDPGALIKNKEAAMRASGETEENELIRKLRQQTEDNRQRNALLVEQKTAENDLGANFGPFDRQVVIMNADGKTFSLLQNPQAMRLKKAGFIEGRKFVKQPTPQEIEDALVSPDFGESIKGVFGLGGGN